MALIPSCPTSGTPSASPEEPQGPQDEGSGAESSPRSGLCCPRMWSSERSLRGTRGSLSWEESWECVCVCGGTRPFWVLFCISISLAISLQLKTQLINWLYTCSIWPLYYLYCLLLTLTHFYCSCNRDSSCCCLVIPNFLQPHGL